METDPTPVLVTERLVLRLARREDAPDTILGALNLNDIRRGATQSCAPGYSLAAEAQGNGSMTEAVRAAVEYAFGDPNLHRVHAAYMPGNVRSGRLLRRLVFIIKGSARDYLSIAGRWEDHILASRTNEAWRE